ncbi:hypothetical protein AAES_05953 [Amazona aestiva]|uniref:Uncharacterized protein n=1 Tax=Amazona aestiva TaxID=12930 RepID=A0A0Q3U3Y6_AMAAE|nr:hypothetical protein AAES_05953 [Amazona aestiva]
MGFQGPALIVDFFCIFFLEIVLTGYFEPDSPDECDLLQEVAAYWYDSFELQIQSYASQRKIFACEDPLVVSTGHQDNGMYCRENYAGQRKQPGQISAFVNVKQALTIMFGTKRLNLDSYVNENSL